LIQGLQLKEKRKSDELFADIIAI